jgi:predicted PurR-regulated permease PerM
MLLQPFINTILTSIVLAYIIYPLYKTLKKYVKNSSFASFIITFFVVTVFLVSLLLIARIISIEAKENYTFIKEYILGGRLISEDCSTNNLCNVMQYIHSQLSNLPITYDLKDFFEKISNFIVGVSNRFIMSAPQVILKFFVAMFTLFFLLRDGEKLLDKISRLAPLKNKHTRNIIAHLKEVVNAVVYGQVLVAGLQATLGIFALWIFGVKSPVLWGVVMFFFALVPYLGTGFVWVPAMLFKFIDNNPFQAFGLLISGLIISTVDNFIRPMIVADKAKIHPTIVLLGVIGGLSLFGFIGLIIGPVILSLLKAFIDIYESENEFTS